MNMEELLLKLKNEYIAELPLKITDLKQLFTAGDSEGLKNAFHKLKGSGKTYGLDSVSMIGKEMERICLDESLKIDLEVFTKAISLLEDIYTKKLLTEVDLNKDPRFAAIQKK
ncbi:MAG: Hpt domain-containing protein [Bdellovibrionales bacterium]|nr:Hpt domain-containing protein [Bdellovibrionales bacterium]